MRNLSQLYTGKMTEYYIIDNNGNQVGPITEVLFYNYGVTASTLVWCEGMSEWKHASEVPGLRHLFGSSIPPTPPVTPPPFCENREQESAGYVNDQGRCQHQQWGQQYNQVCPPTYLVWAILSTLLCCIPLGIISIIFSSRVQTQWNQGDFEGAKKSSQQARLWAIIAGVAGILTIALNLGLFIFSSFLY